MSRDVLLLVNPNAGRVDQGAIGAVARATPADRPLEVAVTEHPDEVAGVLDRLGDRRLLVMGGDGTLHVAVRELHRRGVLATTDVGFVPTGTANAFARAIGLPLDPVAAVHVALDGTPRPIDLLVSDAGHVAVNDLHTGLGVPATQLSARLKPVLGPLTYSVANGLTGLRTSGWSVEVVVDGTRLVGRDEPSLAVMIGNTHLVGDGTELWPGAEPDDGVVDVVVLLAGPRLRRIGLARSVIRGDHVERPDVRRIAGRRIELRGDVPGHNADGELSADAGETTWHVRPQAWSLRCASFSGTG